MYNFCIGTTCTDPGYPNGGYLSTDVTGFEQDKVVTFGCNLAGFTVPANSALKCVLNGAADGLTWNGTTPTECQGMKGAVNQAEILDLIQLSINIFIPHATKLQGVCFLPVCQFVSLSCFLEAQLLSNR